MANFASLPLSLCVSHNIVHIPQSRALNDFAKSHFDLISSSNNIRSEELYAYALHDFKVVRL